MSRVSGRLVTKCIWTDQVRVPLETGAWSPDPTTPLNVDPNGVTIINEATVGRNCLLPSDVAVAVMINQNQDRRAPAGTVVGNSTNGKVYARILDLLGDAARTVNTQGWPQVAEPAAVGIRAALQLIGA